MALEYQHLREIAAQYYFNWLANNSILDKFDTPETIATVCYQLNYPESSANIFEEIFDFLLSFGIFEDAGGTYSLRYSIEELKQQWDNRYSYDQKHPLIHFLRTGLKLFTDFLEGGTGKWDTKLHHYIIEMTLTQQSLTPNYLELFDENLFSTRIESQEIAIFSLFPQLTIEPLLEYLDERNSLRLISHTEESRNQIISFCEYYPPARSLSSQVYLKNDILPKSIDVLIISNGMFYGEDIKSQLKFINKILKDDGLLFLFNNINPRTKIGIEPLLILHPMFDDIPTVDKLNGLLRTNGFSEMQEKPNGYVFVKKLE